ncbi:MULTISPECIES: sugar ABC transporter permease [Turicibacter]|jgi:putative maltose transport system permease protein malG|uniref:ABC transporter permease subunit n=2 Tax=Turicibacter sanguinis TaxID=154288 RepID=A0A173TUD4_9FIRM|nr:MULTISPECIES: sugar ABC transporter permease [Turicibacter]EFF65191.1 putative maltose transport system permease protein MalG [Turicibacter sanguinis PC909]EGC91026.1 ABC transporter, permease protein [Turicibacter sp. HGF1]MBP3902793.1 sugar ABC transporter permease [Turicibacter sp.]MCU7192411.1 sugar ABC transporter permease [Turicibacter sanguinis]MCU7198268.1 sugar ABC transporter permease [Turicibacter sanguinis]
MASKASSKINTMSKIKEISYTILIYLELIFMCIIVLFPIVWIVGSSFNQGSSLATATPFPENPTIEHYFRLFKETNFAQWYLNTLKIAVINMILSVALSTSMGYIFARFRFKGKKPALISVLVLQMFPSFMGMTALYILFLTFNMLDNHWALILCYAAGQIPMNTWLIKGYLGSIPKELDESAMIDGATKAQIFFKIIFPLAQPIISFVAVTQFMAPWMDFIFPRMIISTNSKLTLAVGLYDMINGQNQNNFTMFAAGCVLVAVPITILYVSMQRFLIEGITAGANKG